MANAQKYLDLFVELTLPDIFNIVDTFYRPKTQLTRMNSLVSHACYNAQRLKLWHLDNLADRK